MFTLIGLGVGVAYIYSVIVTLAPQLFAGMLGNMERPAVYFEPAAVITALVLLGQVMELKARAQTSSAMKALLNLAQLEFDDHLKRFVADGFPQSVIDVPGRNLP